MACKTTAPAPFKVVNPDKLVILVFFFRLL